MSVFIRRFTSDPGNAVLTNIEAVDILDLSPPASISGVGTGTACLVGEFENGPFNTPLEVFGANDLLSTFGGFGFVYNGVKANNPAGRKRNADTLGLEAWNGNAFVQLAGKKFSRLICVRVDTTVGSVRLTPSAALAAAIVIPAGTLVSASATAGSGWVTVADVSYALGATAGQDVRVRPATDDGTSLVAAIAAVNTVALPPTFPTFTCNNPVALTAALTETAIDAAYVAAVDSTLDLNGVSHDINLIWAARQSTTVRGELRQNALDASGNGLLGRMACIRPGLNTTRSAAKASTGVGVGVTRNERVVYCYPSVQLFLPTIASVGTAGGYGFSASGLTDSGADSLMVSILSQLPPEENPGQATAYTAAVIGMESGSNAQGYLMSDYISFRASGIAAPRIANGTMVFQSGVTSVDPLVSPELRNIARRRMADFIQDTLSLRLTNFGKKLNSFARRKAIATEIRVFMDGLVSINNPSSQRIDGYSLDTKSGNTPATDALGIYRLILRARTLSSLDAIGLQTEIGESVTVSAV
jgi:hypothetical protein